MYDLSYKRLKEQSRADKYIAQNLGTSRLTSMMASAHSAYLDSPSLANIFASDNYHIHDHSSHDQDRIFLQMLYDSKPENQKLTKEEFDEKYKDSHLEYDPNFTSSIVDNIIEKKRRLDINNYLITNGKNDLLDKAGQIAGGIVGGNIAPVNLGINVATCLIPTGAVLRGAWWAANPIKTNMVKFAIGGGIAQTALEPFVHKERRLEQRDYNISDSIINIAESSIFSAAIPLAAHGVKSAFKSTARATISKWQKFKDNYFATPESLKSEYSTRNPSLDMQMIHLIDDLHTITAPEYTQTNAIVVFDDITSINKKRLQVRESAKKEFPEFFDLEDRIASCEEHLHKEFETDTDVTMLPRAIYNRLLDHRKHLEAIYKKYSNDPSFMKYIRELGILDNKITDNLKAHQQYINGYNLDRVDLYIAKNQLEEGKFIDLDDPKNARSIFDTHSSDTHAGVGDSSGASYGGKASGNKIYDAKLKEANSLHNDRLMAARQIISRGKTISSGFKFMIRQADLRSYIVSRELTNGLMNDLLKSDLLEFFKNKNFEHSIIKELWNITHPDKVVTNSKISQNIATLIYKWQESALTRLSKANPDIEIDFLQGYITRQTHSSWKLKKDGFEKWKNFISPLLDQSKTHDVNLYRIWKNLATGHHLDKKSTTKRTNNLGDYFTKERKLHFKSPDAWVKYNREYGTHNLAHSVATNLEQMGHHIGLIESMGNEPMEFLSELKGDYAKNVQKCAASGDKLAQKELDYLATNALDDLLESIIGTQVEMPRLAGIAQGIRNVKTLASLGRVALSSIPDAAVFASEQIHNGMPYFQSMYNILKALTYSFSNQEKKEFARLLNIGTENLLGIAYTRLNAEHNVVHGLTNITNYYFKLNLMDWWDNSFKSSLGLILSNNLATNVKIPYKNIPKALKKNLKDYNIDGKDWDTLKSFIKKAEDGQEYIIPPIWREGTNRTNEVAGKFRQYLIDRVDTGIPTPHGVERYVATFGTKKGTPYGEAMRMFMQFKQFPITYMMRPLKDYRGSIKTLSTMMVLSTMGGYLSIAANKLLSGQKVPEPNIDTLRESILKGGGLGFYGDFIFGKHNRYGHGVLQSMSGAVAADITDAFAIYSDIKDNNEKAATKKAKSLMTRNLPCRNLFYLTPALLSLGVSQEWIDKNLNAKNI